MHVPRPASFFGIQLTIIAIMLAAPSIVASAQTATAPA